MPASLLVAGYPLPLFALFLDAGIAAGLALALALGRRRGLTLVSMLDAAPIVLVAALIGARLDYVTAHWTEYALAPRAIINVWEGGLSLPGAVAAGALALWLAARPLRLPPWLALDVAAPALALAQAVGRLGCLGAGCAAGRPVLPGSPLPALVLPDSTGLLAARFPSQLAEAGAELLLGTILLVLWSRRPAAGTVAAAYAIGYGIARACFELLRADSTWLGPLPRAVWWAGLAVLGGSLALARSRRRVAVSAGQEEPAGHDLVRGMKNEGQRTNSARAGGACRS